LGVCRKNRCDAASDTSCAVTPYCSVYLDSAFCSPMSSSFRDDLQ